MAEALKRLYETLSSKRPEPAANMRDLIDRTWAFVSNRRFKAVIEAWLAMANDPDLRSEIGPVVGQLAALVLPERMAPSIKFDEERRSFYLMAREAMLGLALGRATTRGKALQHESLVVENLRRIAASLDA